MPIRSYAILPQAEADMEGIWLYTLQHWSRVQADRYHHDLVAVFEALATGRKRGRSVEVREGYLKCPCGSHVIYYRDRGDRLEVVRVLHGSQDAGRHL